MAGSALWRGVGIPAAAVVWLTLGGCSGPNLHGPTAGSAGVSNGRRGSSSTGGGGTSGTGSTTGGGSLACNPNPATCPPPNVPDPLDACAPGQDELVANLVDFVNGSGPITCPIQLADADNPGLSATTDLCGYIRYCVTPGTEISFTAQVSNYVPLNFATVVVEQSVQIPNRPGIPMANNDLLQQLKSLLPNADTSEAMVVVQIEPLNPQPASDAGFAGQECASKSGWQIWLTTAAGDPVDAGVAYVISGTLNPSAGATDTAGFVFFYNVDPGLQTVQPRGYRPRDGVLPDGGVLCENFESAPPLGLTGSVPVMGAELSVIPYVVGPAGSAPGGGAQ